MRSLLSRLAALVAVLSVLPALSGAGPASAAVKIEHGIPRVVAPQPPGDAAALYRTPSHPTPTLPFRAGSVALRKPSSTTSGPTSPLTAQTSSSSPSPSPKTVNSPSAAFPMVNLEGEPANAPIAPPDTQMAVGPTDVVEMVNQVGRLYTRAGAPNGSTFDLAAFFGVPGTNFMSDPRVLYDGLSQRWIAAAMSFQCVDPTCALIAGSQVYLAASKSSSPNPDPSNWNLFKVKDTSTGVLYDQPKLGVSDDKVVVAFDTYGAGGTTTDGAEFVVANKAKLLDGTSLTTDDYPAQTTRFSIAPAQGQSAGATAYAVYNAADGDPLTGSPVPKASGGPAVGLLTITGVPGTPGNSSAQETFLAIQPTAVPPDAAQKGSMATVTTNDDRFLHSVWQNGKLWTFGNDSCVPFGDDANNPRSCARLVQIDTGAGSVAQDFDIGFKGVYIYYPSVSFNGAGDSIVVYNESSANHYVSVAAAGQLSNESGAFSIPVTVKAGEAVYDQNDTDPSVCFGPTTGSNRWGDYAAATPDPADGKSVWVAGEYAATGTQASTAHCNWGTAAGRVAFSGPTVSSVTPQTGKDGGGEVVAITGTNFTAGSQVLFSNTPAASVTVVDSSHIKAITPNLSDVTTDVFVRTAYGTSVAFNATKFRFTAPPVVTAVTPNVGPLKGGNTVTLTGSHFTAATAVHFGNVPAASFSVQSDTRIVAVPPAHPAATVDVIVDVGTIKGVKGATDQYSWMNRSGYWMVDRNGNVFAFGDSKYYGGLGGTRTNVVDIEPTPTGNGYWLLDSAGEVFQYGDALWQGQPSVLNPGELATSISSNPVGSGYWVFTNQGRAFPYGDAHFFGDMSGRALNGPVLGSVATPDGKGYYMVASDGGIFAFGDAAFHGSMGGKHLNGPVVGLAPDPDNVGYWLVATDGGIFAFDAPFKGSMGGKPLNAPVIGMVAYGDGYLMVASDGGIFDFSSKPFLGSLGGQAIGAPVVNVAPLNG